MNIVLYSSQYYISRSGTDHICCSTTTVVENLFYQAPFIDEAGTVLPVPVQYKYLILYKQEEE